MLEGTRVETLTTAILRFQFLVAGKPADGHRSVGNSGIIGSSIKLFWNCFVKYTYAPSTV